MAFARLRASQSGFPSVCLSLISEHIGAEYSKEGALNANQTLSDLRSALTLDLPDPDKDPPVTLDIDALIAGLKGARARVIAIDGRGGSGKSTLARRLADAWPEVDCPYEQRLRRGVERDGEEMRWRNGCPPRTATWRARDRTCAPTSSSTGREHPQSIRRSS